MVEVKLSLSETVSQLSSFEGTSDYTRTLDVVCSGFPFFERIGDHTRTFSEVVSELLVIDMFDAIVERLSEVSTVSPSFFSSGGLPSKVLKSTIGGAIRLGRKSSLTQVLRSTIGGIIRESDTVLLVSCTLNGESIDVIVYEDRSGDGSLVYSESVSVTSNDFSAILENISIDKDNDVWVEVKLSTADDGTTPKVDSIQIERKIPYEKTTIVEEVVNIIKRTLIKRKLIGRGNII